MSRAANAGRANDRIADKAQHLRFVAPVPFLCECDDDSCDEMVVVTLDAFHAARAARKPLLAAGH